MTEGFSKKQQSILESDSSDEDVANWIIDIFNQLSGRAFIAGVPLREFDCRLSNGIDGLQIENIEGIQCGLILNNPERPVLRLGKLDLTSEIRISSSDSPQRITAHPRSQENKAYVSATINLGKNQIVSDVGHIFLQFDEEIEIYEQKVTAA